MPTPEQSSPAITASELQEIVRVFADSDLRELRLSVGAVDLVVSRNEQVEDATRTPAQSPLQPPQPPTVAAQAPALAPATEAPAPASAPGPAPGPSGDSGASSPGVPPGMVELRSPALGTFYRRPAPDKPPFVEVGSQVAVGDSVGTIEVMKMFTAVTADVAGTVTEVCVDDAVLVEHGQPLFYVDPAGS